MRALIALLLAAAPALAVPPHEAAALARDWRSKHEKEIIAELSALVAIPNLASDKANIERNAAFLVEAFTRRGATVKLLRVEGAPPLVVASVNVGRVLNPSTAAQRPPSAADGLRTRPTYTFYAHYDGQPVDATQWATPPWEPVLKDGRESARTSVNYQLNRSPNCSSR